MSVDARIREGLDRIDQGLPPVESLEHYGELGARVRKQVRRRTAGAVIAAVAAIAVGVALVDARLGQDRAIAPVTPSDEWVLVTSTLVGTDFGPPTGDEWREPLGASPVTAYPYWASVDPATRRFLVNADEATALEVLTPGRAEPLGRIPCASDGTGCLGAALGPGPEELTMVNGSFHLLVVGPYGEFVRNLGPAGDGLLNGLAWAPDGGTLAVSHSEHGRDRGSLSVVLRDPESRTESTLFAYSEPAPPWYDADEHRYADWPGAFNSWAAPRLTDLQWAPDSTRLAFAMASTPEGGDDGARHLQWQLFVADVGTGDVEQVASLGRCTEPVDDAGGFAHACEKKEPFLSWTPDGKSITVLADSTLTTYDPTGKELSSEPSDLTGPIVWLTSE